jgi:hypothetical protein
MKEAFEKIRKRLEEKTEFLADCTKYGNKDAEQQRKSYDTMHMYEIADMVEDLIKIVSEVEAEYGNEWISCSERLPEENGRYITTNMYEGEKEEVFDLWYEDGKWFIDAGEDETIRIILAWMPLPESYKPEKGE